MGLDIHEEYCFDKAGSIRKLDHSYSVDDFDDALISYCDDAISTFCHTQTKENSKSVLDNWLIRKDPALDDVIYIDDDTVKPGPSSISSPLLSKGVYVIPTPVSSNSKKDLHPPKLGNDMVPCKHKCKNKIKYFRYLIF